METIKPTASLVSVLVGHLFSHLALTSIEKSYDQSSRGMPMAIKEDKDSSTSIVPLSSIDIKEYANSDYVWHILRSVDPHNPSNLDLAVYEPISWEELQKS